jgi:ABC-type branched-subunit amino acid transport system ATPase component
MLLDEPSLGLAPLLVHEIFDIIGRLNREERVTMLLVEHNAAAALRIADCGYIMKMSVSYSMATPRSCAPTKMYVSFISA